MKFIIEYLIDVRVLKLIFVKMCELKLKELRRNDLPN